MTFPAILSEENADTIQACLCLAHQLLHDDKPRIVSPDERLTKDRIEDVIVQMYGHEFLESKE